MEVPVLLDRSIDPVDSMALDEYLFSLVSRGRYEAAVRVYGWSFPFISIGRFTPYSMFDEKKVAASSIPIIRRITGGNALYHDQDLGYTLIFRLKEEKNIGRWLYWKIGELLQRVLLESGLSVHPSPVSSAASSMVPCHEMVSLYEVVTQRGEKVAGAAQKNNRLAIMQQGSLYLNHTPSRINLFLKDPKETFSSLPVFRGNFLEVAHRLLKILKEEFHFFPISLKIEDQKIEELKRNRYGTKAWTLSKV